MAYELQDSCVNKDKKSSLKSYFKSVPKCSPQNALNTQQSFDEATFSEAILNISKSSGNITEVSPVVIAVPNNTVDEKNISAPLCNDTEFSAIVISNNNNECNNAVLFPNKNSSDKEVVEVSYEDFLSQCSSAPPPKLDESELYHSNAKKRKICNSKYKSVKHLDVAEPSSIGQLTCGKLNATKNKINNFDNSSCKMQQTTLTFHNIVDVKKNCKVKHDNEVINEIYNDGKLNNSCKSNTIPGKEDLKSHSSATRPKSRRLSAEKVSHPNLEKDFKCNGDFVQLKSEHQKLSVCNETDIDNTMYAEINILDKQKEPEESPDKSYHNRKFRERKSVLPKTLTANERIILQKKANDVIRRARGIEKWAKKPATVFKQSKTPKQNLLLRMKSLSSVTQAAASCELTANIRRSSRIKDKIQIVTDDQTYDSNKLLPRNQVKKRQLNEEELAPLFRKRTSKQKPPKITKEELEKQERKRTFLLSGIPEELKKMQAAVASVPPISEYGLLPTISHVQQKINNDLSENIDAFYWNLPSVVHKILLKQDPFVNHSNYGQSYLNTNFSEILQLKTTNSRTIISNNIHERVDSLSQSQVENILQEIQSSNPSFPVHSTYQRIMKKKQEDLTAFAEQLDEDVSIIDPIVDKNIPDNLWTTTYAPQNAADMLSNGRVTKQLKHWLTDWKRILLGSNNVSESIDKKHNVQSNEQANDSDDDFCPVKRTPTVITKKFIVSSDSEEETPSLCNTSLIIGPSGCGKTALVYALARELNYKVFEINSTCSRSAKQVSAQLAETTQSHHMEHKVVTEANQEDNAKKTSLALSGQKCTQKLSDMPSAFMNLWSKGKQQNANKVLTSKNDKKKENDKKNAKCELAPLFKEKKENETCARNVKSKTNGKVTPSKNKEFKKDIYEEESNNEQKLKSKQRLSLRNRNNKRIESDDDEDDDDADISARSKAKTKRKRNITSDEQDLPNNLGKTKEANKSLKEPNAELFQNSDIILSESNVTSTTGAALNLSSLSLILFDDVDITSEEDKGFWSAVQSFMSSTKVPIILTASDPYFVAKFGSQSEYEQYTIPKPLANSIASYLQIICLAEGLRTYHSDLLSLVKHCHGNLRYSLLMLQLIVSSKSFHLNKNLQLSNETETKPIEKKTNLEYHKLAGKDKKACKRSRVILSDDSSRDSVNCSVPSRPAVLSNASKQSNDFSGKHSTELPFAICDVLFAHNDYRECTDKDVYDNLPFKQIKSPETNELNARKKQALEKKKKRIIMNCDLFDSESEETHANSLPTSHANDTDTKSSFQYVEESVDVDSHADGLVNEKEKLQLFSDAPNDGDKIHHDTPRNEKFSFVDRLVFQSVNSLWQLMDCMSFRDTLHYSSHSSSSMHLTPLSSQNTSADAYVSNSVKGNSKQLLNKRTFYDATFMQMIVVEKSKRETNKILEKAIADLVEEEREKLIAERLSFPLLHDNSFHQIKHRKYLNAQLDVMRNLPVSAMNIERLISVDYMPALKYIVVAEKHRREAAQKRRFTHYLDQFFTRSLKLSTLSVLESLLD